MNEVDANKVDGIFTQSPTVNWRKQVYTTRFARCHQETGKN